MTTSIYSAVSESSAVGDDSVTKIGSDITDLTGVGSVTAFTIVAPYYIVRMKLATVPSPTTTIPKVFVAFSK